MENAYPSIHPSIDPLIDPSIDRSVLINNRDHGVDVERGGSNPSQYIHTTVNNQQSSMMAVPFHCQENNQGFFPLS